MIRRLRRTLLTAWTLLLAAVTTATSAPVTPTVTVEMRTEGASGRFRFEPALVWVTPGTTVRFVADSHIHGVRAIPGMLPEGVEPFAGGMGRPLVLRPTVPGVYGFKCSAHYGLGMVGLLVVGEPDPAQLARARAIRHPPAARVVFARLFRTLDCLARDGGCVPEVPVADLRSGRLADHAER